MEIVTMVGGAVIAPLFESLLDSFKSNDLFKYARGNKLLEEVNKWEPELKTIFAVLQSAEELQVTDVIVKSWFNYLRDLAYDVEDVLDELITQARLRKFHADASSSKVVKMLRSGLSLTSKVKFSSDVDSKVKKVSQRLGDIKTRMALPNIAGARNKRVKEEEILARPAASSLVEPKVCGREVDRRAILDMMKIECGDGGISIISIVGMGGLGKTTLAQMVYNDVSLQFEFKAWASIGEDFNLLTVTKTIVKSEGDLDSLQSTLREKISGKKFLIVLDDLWSADYEKWTRFNRPFASGAPGSKFIITTRNKEVSLMTSTNEGYHLERLSDDDCLSLFTHHALGKEDFSEHPDLMEIGQEIVKRCDGLPIAAKALGGLLRGKPNLNDWKNLLHNKLWGEESGILPALRLSYYNLPGHMKRCFEYCAIFPKEYEFVVDDLVLVWLAEGFLKDLKQGYDCFDELFARSLFQRSADDASVFLMHDLVIDLARSISGGVCLNLDEEMNSIESYAEVRHSAFSRGEFDIASRFELRTFLALPFTEQWSSSYISCKVLDVWIPKLKCLRVLSLSGYKIVELPKSIKVLKHLRYLNLSNAQIVTLPNSLCKLFNLQMLILRGCSKLCELPEDFCNLVNLQCLDLRGTNELEEMPLYIGDMPNLRILTKFIVESADGCGIQELLKIPDLQLQGQVHILELQNVVGEEIVDCWRMKDKEKIDDLELEWTDDFDDPRDEEAEKQVLENLQPQKNIQRLTINYYGGKEFPSWLVNGLFKLTYLEIYNCPNVSSLPPFGVLPSLRELKIEGMDGVKEVGMEFYGVAPSSSCSNVFPSLEILHFMDMENWKIWSGFNYVDHEGQFFPKLRKLVIRVCPELVGDFPKSLHSLEELVIRGCKEVVLKRMPLLKSLVNLKMRDISGRVSFDNGFPEALCSLQELVVHSCKELKHLWEKETKIERLGCLKGLRISGCSGLVSLVEGEEGVFPPNLQFLDIYHCDNLERLPNQLQSITSLTYLKIGACPKLATFPVGGLPDKVKYVEISGCDSLATLPKGIMVNRSDNSGIEELRLMIPKVDFHSIPANQVFPTSLKFLLCFGGLETQFMASLQVQDHLSRLTTLVLEGSLESFPASGLPISTLLDLTLGPCENLKSLPSNMHHLVSLQEVCLSECPKISFPERGMPPNLSHLEITDCKRLERLTLSEWRLNRLSRLQTLAIQGAMEAVSSFPPESLPLPASLTSLSINGFQNLKSISSGILRLTSLQKLSFYECPNLKYLPKEGLQPSLGMLQIGYCPVLGKRSTAHKGKYWSLIADIPRIQILSNRAEFREALDFLLSSDLLWE